MLDRELIVDSFAGGGGASLGIAWALGRGPDLAINHDAAALELHARNHPSTRHVLEDVWLADLRRLVAGRPVGLLWASPDCKHFSRAKGSVPVDRSIRSLAWVVVRWASQVRPRVIVLENVREFSDWGPLVPLHACACGWRGTEGQSLLGRTRRRCPRCDRARLRQTSELAPDADKRGATFRLFVNRLRGLSYQVQWRTLDAADFGAPTHRRRLFLVARCDGQAIGWPDPTHGNPAWLDAQPLFDRLAPWRTADECIDWSLACPSIFDRARPLAEKTLRRIAHGIRRYVLDHPRPFLVRVNHGGEHFRGQSLDAPLQTVTGRHGYALVAAYLAKHFGGMVGVPIDDPLPTTTTRGTQNQLVAANLVACNHGDKIGHHAGRGYAFLTRYFGTSIGQAVDEPLYTQTQRARFGLVTVSIEGQPYALADIGMRMLQPRELARCQGFPDTYLLPAAKTRAVAAIGNSVAPQCARAIVQANLCPVTIPTT